MARTRQDSPGQSLGRVRVGLNILFEKGQSETLLELAVRARTLGELRGQGTGSCAVAVDVEGRKMGKPTSAAGGLKASQARDLAMSVTGHR